ncbi:MAG: uracil-DNA glycosylase family protein, partial [Eubacteriales bacterium]
KCSSFPNWNKDVIIDTCHKCDSLPRGIELNKILYGTTSYDYFEYLRDFDVERDTSGWNTKHVMFLLENPSGDQVDKNGYNEDENSNHKRYTKYWPFIGWCYDAVQSFKSKDKLGQKKYGEMILALIVLFELKNIYITNCVKCSKDGLPTQKETLDISNKCIETYLVEEMRIFKPEIIIAFGCKAVNFASKAQLILNNEKPIKYLFHPARRISNERHIINRTNDLLGYFLEAGIIPEHKKEYFENKIKEMQ